MIIKDLTEIKVNFQAPSFIYSKTQIISGDQYVMKSDQSVAL